MMKISIIGSFFKWCAEKIFGGIVNHITNANNNFKYLLGKEPFMGSILWGLLTLLATVLGAIIFKIGLNSFELALAIPVASVCYFVYNVFSIAWQSFKKDRQQLFDNIKQL